ncbi:MAG: helix-turn-helix domain-containing protein [Sulfuricurvum sp.]|uniref:helix-turn-helix domain-containing protein n=1 Tax=Sulfuricurvum sp. TaxID=2025608 RepID=UPI00260A7C9E|nr:helix-turn-helix domain-containing protein [Sulfuricurvum sp.]MDD5159092.1 helix-turn-helix domain-containing protein [Sulfuricurvum sp.]
MSQNHLRNHLKSEFAQIPNALIEDRELSATARALFCYLAVKPDDWKFKMKDIADALLISIPTLRKVIAELSTTGWIDDGGQNRGEKGEFGAKIFSIYPTKYQKIGSFEECKVKKSPQRQKPASVKNRSGKNSALNNTQSKKYSKRINTSSSSSPPILKEDELVGCEIVTTPNPYSGLPENIEELSRQIVIDGINSIARERGGDFNKYREALVKEILSGGTRTITNIRNRRSKLTRERGEQIQAGLQSHGFANIFDYLEEEMNEQKNA